MLSINKIIRYEQYLYTESLDFFLVKWEIKEKRTEQISKEEHLVRAGPELQIES